jgi:WS/DGAT/MGAT family acyltransferase
MAELKIPPLDLMFFLMETSASPKHVGAVQIFKLPGRASKHYLRDLVAAYREAPVAPPFNYRPHFPRTGMPYWEPVAEQDMDFHVRHSALPAPGSDAQLQETVARLHAGPLERDRPVWFCQVIEGLSGGRFAIYTKIHHACIDGVSAIQRLSASLATAASDKTVLPIWSHQTRHQGDAKHGNQGALAAFNRGSKQALAQAKAVQEIYLGFVKMGLQALKLHENKAQLPFGAPRTRMNDSIIHSSREVAMCSIPLARARAIATTCHGKLNDVVLTLVDAALQDYLAVHGDVPQLPLVALCPISIREQGDDSASTKVASMLVRLGDPGADLKQRLTQIVESATASKDEARAMSREGLMDFALVLAGLGELLELSGLERTVTPSYNVLVSNIPGPGAKALYLNGSKMRGCFPISTLLPGANLNVTVVTLGNAIDFGLLADKHAMPDIELLAGYIEARFAELERQLKVGPKARKVKAGSKKSKSKQGQAGT